MTLDETTTDDALIAGPSRDSDAETTVVVRPLQQVNGTADEGGTLLHQRKLSVPQAAKVMGIGETKLRELLRQGGIPAIRIMGKTLLVERDLDMYLQRHYGAPHVRDGRLDPASRRPKPTKGCGLLRDVKMD